MNAIFKNLSNKSPTESNLTNENLTILYFVTFFSAIAKKSLSSTYFQYEALKLKQKG